VVSTEGRDGGHHHPRGDTKVGTQQQQTLQPGAVSNSKLPLHCQAKRICIEVLGAFFISMPEAGVFSTEHHGQSTKRE